MVLGARLIKGGEYNAWPEGTWSVRIKVHIARGKDSEERVFD